MNARVRKESVWKYESDEIDSTSINKIGNFAIFKNKREKRKTVNAIDDDVAQYKRIKSTNKDKKDKK